MKFIANQIEALLLRWGYIPVNKLNFAYSVGKRLDEYREVVEAIAKKTNLCITHPWHVAHLATQDDYLMRLYHLANGVWPNDLDKGNSMSIDKYVRKRPAILGPCRLPEYTRVNSSNQQI